MKNSLYKHTVIPRNGLDEVLKKFFRTHLGIYNHSLEILKENPRMEFTVLREQIFRYVEENEIPHLHIQVVQNELYYQYKKFREGNVGQKLLSSIQYFTMLTHGFNNTLTQLNEDRTQLSFVGHPGYLELTEPLPVLDHPDTPLYLNLSFSSMENQFLLSVFENTNLPIPTR